MQIPIISGIYATENADFRQQYPYNMMPVALDQGISKGYLRPASGVSYYPVVGDPPSYTPIISGTGFGGFQNALVTPGTDIRGIYNWNGICYIVAGNYLYTYDENGYFFFCDHDTSVNIAGGDRVTMTNSFDYLAIAGGNNLYLYNPDATFPANRVKQNTDADLGTVLDLIYIDGYFMTTDGEYLVITELGDPFSVSNLKYGSSEIDPDPVVGLLKLNNEVYAINRYTIEAFYNKGGNLFPFERIDGSRMYRGAIGTHAKCVYMERIAFLGSGKNESPSIWLGINAQTQKIASREIDLILQEYTEDELKSAVLETRVDTSFNHLWVRLPDKILIFDGNITETLAWFIIDTGPKNICWVHDKWLVGNTTGDIGYLDESVSTIWEQSRNWSFQTKMIYNESNGAIINELELIALPGRTILGIDPTIWTSYTTDGEVYSQEWAISAGKQGERNKRLCWFQQGHFSNYRSQKFRGNSDSHISIARIEAQVEGLLY